MTVHQTDLRPAFVEPIPEPRVQIQRMMLAASMLIDGSVDTNPGRFQRYLANTFLMPHAAVVIGGTICRRPLVLREFADVCRPSGLDGILVRLPDEPTSAVTFDVKVAGDDRMLCAYRLWMPQPSGAAWLVPSAGSAPYVRFDPVGIELGDVAPFSSDSDRDAGCKFGAEFIAIATKGWF